MPSDRCLNGLPVGFQRLQFVPIMPCMSCYVALREQKTSVYNWVFNKEGLELHKHHYNCYIATEYVYVYIKVHSHWRGWTRGPALWAPHCRPAQNTHIWIKSECSRWRGPTCGPACGEKPADGHAVISSTASFSLAYEWCFWG